MYRRIFFLLTIAMLTLLIALTVAQAQAGPPTLSQPPRLPPPPPDRQTAHPMEIESLAPSGIVRYVSTTGMDSGDCTGSSNPCRTVQYAVDVSGDGDEIRVAEGTYTDIHSRLGITQTVYLSRSLILRGGYKADFSDWDPAQYTTTLDAGGQGRVLYITGVINPTVEGLQLAHGDATGLGGDPWGNDSGGGIYLYRASAIISGCRIYSNTAAYGGGLYLYIGINARLMGNTITGNSADRGGGLYLFYSTNARLTGNTITGNFADHGGGLYLSSTSDLSLQNDLVADNSAGGNGGGIYISGSSPTLRHLTLARNGGSEGIYVAGRAVLTNTILVSHAVGIGVTSGSAAVLEATLWGSGTWANGADYGGPGTITTGTVNLWADPAFLDPDHGDYHIQAASPAVDAGVDAGVATDIDGDARPAALGYDIGADEVPGPALHPTKEAEREFYNVGETMTYTLRIPNDGASTALGVRITDTLPAAQRPASVTVSPPMSCTMDSAWGGTVACGPTDIPAGATVLITLTTQLTTAFSGHAALPMEDHLEARGSNAAASTSLQIYLQDCHVRINDGPTEYHNVQQAVGAAADGDLVKVAGLCAGIEARDGVTQTLYLSKTVTVRGGYSTDFSDWDPARYTTTLDAMDRERVLYITGHISPTIEGLHLIHGDATGLGGTPWGWGNAGGGVYIYQATVTMSNCRIYSSTAYYGGGLFMDQSDHTRLMSNTVTANTAKDGSGLYLYQSDNAWLTANIITGNAADDSGGLYLDQSHNARLTANTIASNTAAASVGGGLCLYQSHNAQLTANTITGNIAKYGGGLFLDQSDNTQLMSNTITANTANDDGGGLRLNHGDNALLRANTITGNTANDGGGLYSYRSDNARLTANTVASNTAAYGGGGLYLDDSADALLTANTVAGNAADHGGGLYLSSSNNVSLTANTVTGNSAAYDGGGLYLSNNNVSLTANTITGNTAADGGGLYLYHMSNASLQNDLITDNSAGSHGGGIYIVGDRPPTLRHLTLARNGGREGIYVTGDYWTPGYAVLTNTILVSHTVGISVTAGSTATLEATLWGSGAWANGADYGGPGSITTGTVNIYGDPAFVNPSLWDYHLGAGSAAIDAGVDAGVTTDMDGEPRPLGLGYDIGADEWVPCQGLTAVVINGPMVGYTNTVYSFTAAISPTDATTPITYTWTPTPTSGQGTSAASYTWDMTGTQPLTVTARNCGGAVTATHTMLLIPANSRAVVVLPDADSILTDTTGLTITIEVPTGAVSEPVVLVYTPLSTPTHPLTGDVTFAGRAFRLEVYRNGILQPGFAFDSPITLTLSYADSALDGLDEGDLRLYYWNGSAWADVTGTCAPPATYHRDPDHNRLAVGVCHLTEFALAGQGHRQVYLPLVLRNR